MAGKKEEGEVSMRTAVQIHDTLYVSIPKAFVKRLGIKKGDTMVITTGKTMTVKPWSD